MKFKSKKIVGILIILAGILELVVGISEGTVSAMLIGLGFCMIGSLYFMTKRK